MMRTEVVMGILVKREDGSTASSDVMTESFEELGDGAFSKVEELGHELRARLEVHARQQTKERAR